MLILGLVVVAILAVVSLLSPPVGLLCYTAWKILRPQEFVIGLGGGLPLERFFGIALIIGIFLHLKVFRAVPFVSNRLNWALLAFLGVNYLSIVDTLSAGESFWTATEFAKTVVLYFIIINLLDTPRRLRQYLWVYITSITWIAAASLHGYQTGGSIYMYEASSSSADAVQRASGLGLTFSNPNNLAEQIVLALPFTFALLVVERKWWQRVVLIGFLATNLACLIFTGSRAGMMQLVAVVLAIGWQSKRKLVLFPVLALFLLAVWWATPIEYQHRYATLSTIIEDPESDASAHGRIVGWKVAWQIFQDRPLLGVGAGNFPRAFERFYSYEGRHGWFQPHNLPGQLLGTLGLLGAVAFGIYICVLLSESAAVSQRIRFSPCSPALLDWANRSTRIIVFTLFVGGVANHNLYLLNWYLAGALVVVAKRLTMEKLKENGNGHGKAHARRGASDFGLQLKQ